MANRMGRPNTANSRPKTSRVVIGLPLKHLLKDFDVLCKHHHISRTKALTNLIEFVLDSGQLPRRVDLVRGKERLGDY